MRFFKSLQAKYLLIILMALFVVQISLLISGFIWLNASVEDVERGYAGIEDKWHQDAGGIKMVQKTLSCNYSRNGSRLIRKPLCFG